MGETRVEAGGRGASIVVAESADRVVRFAAAELRQYLGQMTGVRFPVREVERLSSSKVPAFVLGMPSGDSGELPDPCRNPFDGFTLKTIGTSTTVWGHNSRSVLYGVYALLEELGCRFVEPGIEHVPRLRVLRVPRLNRTEVASFPLRNIFRNLVVTTPNEPFRFLDPALHIPQIDWMAKRRLNHYEFYIDYYRYDLWEKHKKSVLDALRDRGFDLEVTHHSIHYFCPPDENHDFGDYGPATYQRRHPEWYIPAHECGPRGRWQTRVEIPAVREVITRRYLEYFNRNRELNVLGLWPDDVPMNAPGRNMNPSDGYLKTLWNRVSRALAAELPGKRLGIIAYFELIRPPRRVQPHPNQHCWFCPIERDYRYPLGDRRNRYFIAHLRGWTRKLAPYQSGIFEYYGWAQPFIPHYSMMKESLSIYRDLGVGGVYGWASFTYNLLGVDYRWALDLVQLPHLLWNVETDTRAVASEWAAHVFGPAGDEVLAFYDGLLRSFRREAKKGFGPNRDWMDLDVFRKAQLHLARARRAAPTAEAERRIDLIEKTAASRLTENLGTRPPMARRYPGV